MLIALDKAVKRFLPDYRNLRLGERTAITPS